MTTETSTPVESSQSLQDAADPAATPTRSRGTSLLLMLGWTAAFFVLLQVFMIITSTATEVIDPKQGSVTANLLEQAEFLVAALALTAVFMRAVRRSARYLVRTGTTQRIRGLIIITIFSGIASALPLFVAIALGLVDRSLAEGAIIPSPTSILIALMFGAGAGISEEMWRAISLRIMHARTHPATAVICTSIPFALMHVWVDDHPVHILLKILSTLAFGIALGALMVFGVPVRVAMLTHALHNALLVAMVDPSISLTDVDTSTVGAADVALFVSVTLVSGVIAVFAWRHMMRAHRAGYPPITAESSPERSAA